MKKKNIDNKGVVRYNMITIKYTQKYKDNLQWQYMWEYNNNNNENNMLMSL